jgi:hypothetical protein
MRRYEVVVNRSVDIQSTPKTKSRAHGESQTRPLEQKDVALEPIEPDSKSTQTEKFAAKPVSAKHLRINPALVQLILNELAKCEQENEYFRELDAFHHQNQALQLDELRTISVEAVIF